MRYLTWSVLGRLQRLPDYRLVKAGSISLIGPPGAPVQCDGDIVGSLPMEVSESPRLLPLLVPNGPIGDEIGQTVPAATSGM